MQEIKFLCSGCGSCCRSIGSLTQEDKIKLEFPYNSKEDGSCEKLGEDGKCTIYDTRPDICSVEKTYNKFHLPKGRKKVDIYISENKICNELILKSGMDEKYLIDLQEYLKYI